MEISYGPLYLKDVPVTYCCITSHPKTWWCKPPIATLMDSVSGIWTWHSRNGLFLLHLFWGLCLKDS